MIDVVFYMNNSPNYFVHKNITQITTITGDFNEFENVDRLSIEVETSINLLNCNYAYCALTNRYYYCNVTLTRENAYRINMHTDVLSSFWNEISNSQCIIESNENKYNMYINNGVFDCRQDPYVITKELSGGFTERSYVMVVSGS